LLHGDAMFDIAQPRSAVLLLHRDAQDAEFSELRPKLARKLVCPVDVIGERSNFIDGKAPHALANGIGSVAEPEVEAAVVVSGHLSILARSNDHAVILATVCFQRARPVKPGRS